MPVYREIKMAQEFAGHKIQSLQQVTFIIAFIPPLK